VTKLTLASLALAALPVLLLGQARGGGYKAPEGPAPKNPWGKPDFNGVWQRPYVADVTRNGGQAQAGAGELAYTEWGKQQWETYKPEEGDYTGACLPFGLMRSVNSPDPIQIMQNEKFMSFLYEQNTWFKVLPTDGRAHNTRKVPTWYGDSVGHYEGDTLVIVTKNFNGLTKLDTNGHPHSDKMVLTEKFTRRDLGHIDYEITVDDPVMYTEPWTIKKAFTLRADWQIQEYSCEENNKGFFEGRVKAPEYMGKQ
jgi:hypothetical protein